jgi:hypothetical protein
MPRLETFALGDHNRTRVTTLRRGNSGGNFDLLFCIFVIFTDAWIFCSVDLGSTNLSKPLPRLPQADFAPT